MTQKLLNRISGFIFLLLLLVVAQGTPGYAQAVRSDIELLSEHICPGCDQHSHGRISLLQTRSGSWLARNNPVSLSFAGLMFVYQRYISPQLPSECLYESSCSHFSKNLVKEYGLIRGVFFTADRLTRCNRVSALDVNPIVIGEESGKIRESVDIYNLHK